MGRERSVVHAGELTKTITPLPILALNTGFQSDLNCGAIAGRSARMAHCKAQIGEMRKICGPRQPLSSFPTATGTCRLQPLSPAPEASTSTTPSRMAFPFPMRALSAADSMTIPERRSAVSDSIFGRVCKRRPSSTSPVATINSSGLMFSISHFLKGRNPMRICLVATFPPSGRQLNEYAFHIARELQRNPDVELTDSRGRTDRI